MSHLTGIAASSREFVKVCAALALGLVTGPLTLAGCDREAAGPPRPDLQASEIARSCVGGPKFDPAGEKNVGNGHGDQFIGGQCLSAADCASGCCALPCGICSGPGAQFQAGKQGCGFRAGKVVKMTAPLADAAPAPVVARPEQACVGGPPFDASGDKNVGNGRGEQFIGGQCLGAADCASGCCALPCGICSGPGAQFQAGKQGCGFGGDTPMTSPAVPPAPAPADAAPPVVVQPASSCVGGPPFDPSGEKNVGNRRAQQFIGGQCLSVADCASGCCAFPCGICSGPAAQFQAGKLGCGFGDLKAPPSP
jgi:hypothetical protein